MAEPVAEARERERDLDRFLTFVDAIVAIAITLLVLPLVDVIDDLGEGSVTALLRAHQAEFWSFLLSFAVIARLWLVQRRAVTHLTRLDSQVVWLLLLWTLTIVFLPFPTALVAHTSDQVVTKALYIGTVLLSMVTLALAELVIVRRPEITDGLEPPPLRGSVVNVGLLALALVLALVFPVTSYYPLLLLAADNQVDAVLHRVSRRYRSARS